MIPRASVADAAALERVPGCLGVRQVYDDWHVVMEGDPETVGPQLQISVGANDIRCVRVPLEELFIEMVGGER
jgi:hypothetical protein